MNFKKNVKLKRTASSRHRFCVYLIFNAAIRFIFGLSIQYVMLCSTFALFYDEIRHQQRFLNIL